MAEADATATATATAPPRVRRAGVRRTIRMSTGRLALLSALLAVSAAGLGLGLVGPCMTLTPAYGDYDGWVRALRPDLTTPTTYSILSGLRAMHHSGNTAIAVLLLGFSVVFPTLKLAAMAWGAAALRLGVRPALAVRVTHHLGKFSMLDVLVIALFILAAKGLPGGTTIALRWGVWSFAVSVVLSLVISVLLYRTKPAREQPTQP